MIRAIISAFIGYAVMVACVMAGNAGIWYSLGNKFASSDETTLASTGLSVAALICGLLAAAAGGCVAAMIGGPKGRLAVRVLVSLIIIFGGMDFISKLDMQSLPLPADISVRDHDFFEVGQHAVIPMWYNAAMVVVGGVGAWLGGRICLPRRADQAVEPSVATAPKP
jgi:hypothetical protein